jgi:tetratricopeptide (TPR) repeat protein
MTDCAWRLTAHCREDAQSTDVSTLADARDYAAHIPRFSLEILAMKPWKHALTLAALASITLTMGCGAMLRGERLLPRVREDADKAFDRGDYVQARADYTEYLEQRPGEARVRNRLAQTMILTGDANMAVDHAQIAYSSDPTRGEFVETFADALLASNRNSQLFDLLRSQATDRGTVSDYDRLGRFSARAGDADGAEEAFLFAAKIDGGRSVGPQIALADFFESIGDKPKALERLRMASWIDPLNKPVAERIRAYGQIPGPSFALQPTEWE